MRIAVLMSVYNGHKYLNAQLLGLAEQTVKNNIIVYIRDDGSEDNSFEIIDSWKEKLNIVLYKGCNVGPAMSFWKFFMNEEIHADYYAFCDQDDIWDSDKIELGIKHLTGAVHFCACNCRIIDENGNVVKREREKSAPEVSIPRLFVSGCTQGCSMVFTDALRKYLMNLKIHCISMHDVILMLYEIQFGKIFFNQEPHFSYRVHSNNVVAKENKLIVQNLKTIYWNWKNRKRSLKLSRDIRLYANCQVMIT